jgi:hypothetical protein
MTYSPEDLVPAAGTIRRVQALAVAGFPLQRTAYWLGMDGGSLAHLMTEPTVKRVTAVLMARIYDRVSLADPIRLGVHPVNVRICRERAAALGWAPVGAWDDDTIDDPATYPEWTGHCGKARGVDLHARHGIPLCAPCKDALYRRQLRNAARELRATSSTRA